MSGPAREPADHVEVDHADHRDRAEASGAPTKCAEPRRPDSSPVKAAKSTLRAGLGPAPSRSAARSTAGRPRRCRRRRCESRARPVPANSSAAFSQMIVVRANHHPLARQARIRPGHRREDVAARAARGVRVERRGQRQALEVGTVVAGRPETQPPEFGGHVVSGAALAVASRQPALERVVSEEAYSGERQCEVAGESRCIRTRLCGGGAGLNEHREGDEHEAVGSWHRDLSLRKGCSSIPSSPPPTCHTLEWLLRSDSR